MLKVHAAVEVQLLLYVLVELLLLLVPKTKIFDLNRPNGFSFQRSMILIGSK